MNPILTYVVWWAIMLACVDAVSARDDGRFAQSPHKNWVEGLRDRNGVSCCDTADGYDVQWDIKDGQYRVFIEGTWYVVPPTALLDNIPNRLGVARVWYAWSVDNKYGNRTPMIRCFLPGTQS